MHIYIFSYNRGRYLANCVNSVRALAPDCRCVVVDDNSDDPETVSYLASAGSGVEVIRPPRGGDDKRHGGLYANMQTALEHATTEIIAFMQDDMQIVRPVTDDDTALMQRYFAAHEKAAFLYGCFLKGRRRKMENSTLTRDGELRLYHRDAAATPGAASLFYSDVCVLNTTRLRRAGWSFTNGEFANGTQAGRMFSGMGIMADPFVMYLPEVPMYRSRMQTLSMKWTARANGGNPKAYVPMTAGETEDFKRRDLAILPFAEDFLQCTVRVRRPFVYPATRANPLLHAAHKLELRLRKALARLRS